MASNTSMYYACVNIKVYGVYSNTSPTIEFLLLFDAKIVRCQKLYCQVYCNMKILKCQKNSLLNVL